MARYIDETDVYKLVEPRGVAKVHCSQIDELPRADVVPKSEVENIFEEFRAEMRSRLNSCDELYKKDPDDFYVGQTWAYSAAIFVLENIIKKHTEGKNENT